MRRRSFYQFGLLVVLSGFGCGGGLNYGADGGFAPDADAGTGQTGTLDSGTTSAETCGDDIDNNGNGSRDEECPCNSQTAVRPCARKNSANTCVVGTQRCRISSEFPTWEMCELTSDTQTTTTLCDALDGCQEILAACNNAGVPPDKDWNEAAENAEPCSQFVRVPGWSNPFFAGMPNNSFIAYPGQDTDHAANQGAINAGISNPQCLTAGQRITFDVRGTLSNGGDFGFTPADGNLNNITSHSRGAYFGKSNVTAPLAALLGVFVNDNVAQATPPANLIFSGGTERDYLQLRPALNQLFFIGDGRTGSNKRQVIVVPTGATKFFFGTMDSFEWNDNHGEVFVSVNWVQ